MNFSSRRIDYRGSENANRRAYRNRTAARARLQRSNRFASVIQRYWRYRSVNRRYAPGNVRSRMAARRFRSRM